MIAGQGVILSFKVKDKSLLTFSLNDRFGDGTGGHYPTLDYFEIYDGHPTADNYTDNFLSGMNKLTTLTYREMTFVDASKYIAQCSSGYMTLKPYAGAAPNSICFVKDIVLK